MTGRTRARLRSIATFVATLTIGFALAVPAAADPPAGGETPTTETSTPTETSAPIEISAPAGDPAPGGNPAPAELAPADQQKVSAAAERAQVEVSAEFDKSLYTTGELITVKLRVKNVGTENAVGLFVGIRLTPTDLLFNRDQLGELRDNRPGATIEPGATLEKTLSGHMAKADADTVTLTGNVFGQDGFGFAEFAFSAPVKKTTSHVAGVVFGDKNGNGTIDKDEELAGAKLTWTYADGGQDPFRVSVTSGPDGTFDFGNIPTVRYFTGGEATGWVFPFGVFEVDDSEDNTDLLVRAAVPLKGALHAAMEFTKDSYQVGELAHVKVTLSNTGPIPIVDIATGCNRSDEGPQLRGTGPGWVALDDGVTLAPGETKVLDVSENVPEKARDFGFVLVSCDFGIGESDIEDHAFAGDTALVVTDARATFGGEVKSFPDGPAKPGVGLAGVRVVLVADGPCPIIGDTVTDANGEFTFTNLVPGPDRKLYLVPPQGWTIQGDNPLTTWIVANRNDRLSLVAEHRDGTAPTVPTQPASCSTAPPPPTPTTPAPTEPAPQGRSSSGLASTGASVIGLSALGALALLLGAASVVVARRRRNTAS